MLLKNLKTDCKLFQEKEMTKDRVSFSKKKSIKIYNNSFSQVQKGKELTFMMPVKTITEFNLNTSAQGKARSETNTISTQAVFC